MKRLLVFFLLTTGTLHHALAADKPTPSAGGGILQVILVLVLVLGLMVGAAWLLKRFNAAGMKAQGGIKIIGGVPVGSRERIMVVEVADQWIVVGVTSNNITALSTMPRQVLPPSQDAPGVPNHFASKLKQLLEKRNGQ